MYGVVDILEVALPKPKEDIAEDAVHVAHVVEQNTLHVPVAKHERTRNQHNLPHRVVQPGWTECRVPCLLFCPSKRESLDQPHGCLCQLDLAHFDTLIWPPCRTKSSHVSEGNSIISSSLFRLLTDCVHSLSSGLPPLPFEASNFAGHVAPVLV